MMTQTLQLVKLDNSIQLAQAFGLFFTIYGFSVWFNKDAANKVLLELKNSYFNQLTIAVVTLFIGSFMVAFHNEWAFNHVGAVTLVGWILFLFGIMICFFMPRIMNLIDVEKQGRSLMRLDATFAILIGLFMLYIGFLT